MIAANDVRTLARARLRDAKTLLAGKRYDGGAYLCGYAVEIALKYRVCRTLGWSAFPETANEFRSYRSFQVHDLDILLHLSGREAVIRSKRLTDWSLVNVWTPELRYRPVGHTTEAELRTMLTAAANLLKSLL